MIPGELDPMPAEEVVFFALDTDGVLFSERAQSLYALNTCAAYIWCCLAERLAPGAVVERLQRDFAMPPGEGRAYLAQTTGEWARLGLLAGCEPPIPAAAPAAPATDDDRTAIPPLHAHRVHAEHCYRLLDTQVRVRYDTAEQCRWLTPVLGHLACESTGKPDATLDVVARDGVQDIYLDGVAVARRPAVDRLAPLVKSIVDQLATSRFPCFADVHAGVVGEGERCVLLPGVSGSGKSCLTAGLIRMGFEYFSDECALLEPGTFRVRPVPLPPGIKTGGWDAMRDLYPGLNGLPVHQRQDGKRVRYLPPPPDSLPRDLQRSRPVRAIVFPSFVPAAPLRLAPLSRVSAVRRLMDDCVAVPGRLTRENVAQFIRWIRETGCYTLRYGSIADAATAVRGLLSGGGG